MFGQLEAVEDAESLTCSFLGTTKCTLCTNTDLEGAINPPYEVCIQDLLFYCLSRVLLSKIKKKLS